MDLRALNLNIGSQSFVGKMNLKPVRLKRDRDSLVRRLFDSPDCSLGRTALLLVVLLGWQSQMFAQDGERERDRRRRDGFGERLDQRRAESRSRFRNPIVLARFRTIDGTMNNIAGVYWGAAGANLRRRVPSAYADGVWAPSGGNRKPARSISNYFSVQNQSIPNARGLSSMVWQWGQFLDHDISITESHDPLVPMPIIVPTGDRFFDPFGGGGQTISFFRAEYRAGGSPTAPREQVNSITSWVDASNVYGSDEATARSLRTFSDGLMKTSEGNLLPVDETCFFYAGDVRANEQVGLTSMHTIFVREHNRIAIKIAATSPTMTDEQIYVRAKKHVGALMQSVTYNEFLPALMGPNPLRPYRGYNPLVFPNISNVFSTAAYRFGHSMLNTDMLRLDNKGNRIAEGNLSLAEAFFNPANLKDHGVDPYLKGLSLQEAQEIDTRIVGSVRNFLFGAPGSGGFDLAALNIQRGRDHGLADFNSIRQFYRLPRYTSFNQISRDPQIQASFSLAYSSVDEIDPWVGMLAEDHLPGKSIGQTLDIILRQQFEALRDADRFWYERDFSDREIDEIERTSLADIIQRNSGVRNLQPNVFLVPAVR